MQQFEDRTTDGKQMINYSVAEVVRITVLLL